MTQIDMKPTTVLPLLRSHRKPFRRRNKKPGTWKHQILVMALWCSFLQTIWAQAPNPAVLSSSTASICAGDSVTLTATLDIHLFGNQATQNNATFVYPAPYTLFYGGQRMQMLVLASELTAAGFSAGSPLKSIFFPVASLGTRWAIESLSLKNFKISIGATSLSEISSFQSGLTTVYNAASYTPSVGYDNSHVFSTPYVWDGTSNLIIETTFSNNTSIMYQAASMAYQYFGETPFQSCLIFRSDDLSASQVAVSTTVSYATTKRPDFALNNRSLSISWQPSTGFPSSTLTATTTSISTKIAPASTSTYSLISSNGTSSTPSNTVSIAINTAPAIATITVPASFCSGSTFNLADPQLSNNGGSTLTSKGWYLNGAAISNTTTLAASDDGKPLLYKASNACGTGTSNTMTLKIKPSPTLTATASSTLICAGTSVILSATGNASTYVWAPGGATTTTLSVSPDTTTTYTVVGTNSIACSASGVVAVTVSSCTGIEESASGKHMNVFPNPSNGLVTLAIEGLDVNHHTVELRFYDAYGQLVFQETMHAPGCALRLEELDKGLYFVEVRSDQQIIFRNKLVLEY